MSKVQHIGYVRVSSHGQNSDRQLSGLTLDRVFEDKASGKNMDRPALRQCIDYCRSGDMVHVHSLDRMARNLEDLRNIIKEITSKGAIVRFEKEGLTFSGDDSPVSNLLLSMLGAVAEFERELIRERQREGIDLAKAKGKYRGRKPSLKPDQVAELKAKAAAGVPKAKLAREFKISRASTYKYLSVTEATLPN